MNTNIFDANLNENTEFVSNLIFYTDIKEVFTDDELVSVYQSISVNETNHTIFPVEHD